ncbi:MAG: hypothetical protein ISN28_15725 [Ectothiorhodospiraceae bacterium AqS1]|nr:hypothetical protein [Ectothiorhodospiraceae bacterium AqS1]
MPRCLDDCKSNQQGSLEVMPRLTGETQVAVSDCSVECRFEHEDNYGTCLANCQANQQGSVEGTQTASHCVWGPRGYMCFPSNQQGSLEVMPRLTGETQVAVNDCSVECRFEHEDNYGTCLANCQANQQGSVDGTQTAAFCVWTPRGYMCIPQSSSNSVEGTGQSLTRFASSVRLGDPQPMCGTDAWACFNGTDDESIIHVCIRVATDDYRIIHRSAKSPDRPKPVGTFFCDKGTQERKSKSPARRGGYGERLKISNFRKIALLSGNL